MVLFDRHQNEASESAFAVSLEGGELDAASECKARFHLAQSVWKQRNPTRAAPLFTAAEQACQRAGDADTRARALYQRGRCLSLVGDEQGALAEFARLEADHPDHRLADGARPSRPGSTATPARRSSWPAACPIVTPTGRW